MANQRQRHLMQEALDENLPQERLHELYQELDESPVEAAEFSRLRQVDRLLRTAPMANAPEGLALKIMARLAEGLQSQKLLRPSSLALAIGLAVLALGLMPLLAVLGWAIISAVGNAGALNALLQNIFNLLSALMNSLSGLVQSAQQLLETYPEAPIAVFTLIPAALVWLWRASRTKENLD